MRAWSVTDDDDDEGYGVVWADTRNQARYRGMREIDADEYIGVIARRLPAADGLSWADLTPTWWMSNGFWVRCDGCDGPVYGYEDDMVLTRKGTHRERVYCCWECFSKHVRKAYRELKERDERNVRIQARKQAA